MRLLRVCGASSFPFQNRLMSEFPANLPEYSNDVWRTAYRLLNDSEDAGECFQQTFADALKIDPATVHCWRAVLIRIATRRAMDFLRRRYRDHDSFRRLETEPLTEDPPEADLAFKELRRTVRETLATLPANQAEAFWMRHIDQLSTDEVSRQLGVERGHVRVLVHRAVAHLRHSLQPEYGEFLALREEK